MCRPIAATAIACLSVVTLGAPQEANQAAQAQTPGASRATNQEIQQAKRKLEAGSTGQAIAILRRVIRREPENAHAHLLLGTALALVLREAEAIKELRRAVELRPHFAPGYYALGTALAREADYQAAREAFERAVELDPEFADAQVSLGLVLAQQKQLDFARRHFERAAGLQGQSPAAAYSHFLIARVLAEQNKLSEAQRELETAIKVRPDYAEAYLSLGLLLKNQADDERALEAFKKATELAPQNPAAQLNLGEEYARARNYSAAVEHLREARRLDPGSRSALYQLCGALRKDRNAGEARSCNQKFLEMAHAELVAGDNLAPAGALNNEGVELEKAGHLKEALQKYKAAAELAPSQMVFRRNYALALCRLGRWDEAVVELKRVLKTDPGDGEATRTLYIALDQIARASETSSK